MADIGVQSAVYIDGIDTTALLREAKFTDPRQALDITTFRPAAYARQYIQGLAAPTLNLSGYCALDYATASILMEAAVKGNGRQIAVGAGGFDVGNLVLFMKSYKTNTDLRVMSDGVLAVSAAYQGTSASPALCAGVSLYTPHGDGILGQDEVQLITLTNAPSSLQLAVQKVGGGATATFYPSDSTTVIAAAIQTVYGGTPTVTSSRTTSTDAATGETLNSGTLSVDFGGTLADTLVTAMQILAGAEQQVNLTAVTGNGTFNGATIHPLDPAATVQTNVRATGGNYAAAVVQGQSAITTPAVNEVETIVATAGTGYDGASTAVFTAPAAFSIVPGASLSSIQATLATAYGVTNGDIVVGGTSAAAVSGASIIGTGTATGGGGFTNAAAANAFSGSGATATALPAQLVYTVPTAVIVNKYTIVGGTTGGTSQYSASAWTFEGWNGSAWVVLDTRSGQNIYSFTPFSFTFANNTAYTSYRLNISATQGGFSPVCQQLTFFLATSPASLNLTATFSGATASGKPQTLMASSTTGVTTARTATGALAIYSGRYNAYIPFATGAVALSSVTGTGYSASSIQAGGATATPAVASVSQTPIMASGGAAYNLINATGNGAAVNDQGSTIASSNGAEIMLQVIGAIGSGKSLSFKVQHAVNAAGSPGAWVDLAGATFTATATGAQRVSIAAGVTINPFVRAVVTAVTGTFTATVLFARL